MRYLEITCLHIRDNSDLKININERVSFKAAWISLAIIGVAILLFGFILALFPVPSDSSSIRAIGIASIGMGFFGFLITIKRSDFMNGGHGSLFGIIQMSG